MLVYYSGNLYTFSALVNQKWNDCYKVHLVGFGSIELDKDMYCYDTLYDHVVEAHKQGILDLDYALSESKRRKKEESVHA